MRLTSILVAMCSLLVGMGDVNGADRREESVVLVQMSFDRGQWSAIPLKILPCGAPSKPDALSRVRSMFQLTDERGKVLFRRYITNPRIILVEDPKDMAPPLSKVEFTLAVPLVDGATTFQFFERERDLRDDYQRKDDKLGSAAAAADLRKVIRSYENRSRLERAPCQIISPKPEDPKKLVQDINTAISVETITSLIASDQHLLIKRGLELKLDPMEMEQLVYSYRDHWAEVRLNKEQVEKFLKRYRAAFQEAVKNY